ncbi:unnamed protein product [Notodromas monacha]|uniref:U1 small nuclear ribonucleoprotein 70 kDa n=1 Tax=Notodromas monacha TaxID=399045 RepID=A0A7R9BPS5_9CRUS|nr:unnamed protein product [Notodromas monacha]CAG0918581.1 unnamed protein product [Notodromas monacha]
MLRIVTSSIYFQKKAAPCLKVVHHYGCESNGLFHSGGDAISPTPETQGCRRFATFGGRMTAFLPPNLLALFAPRDPIPYIQPTDKLPHERKTNGYAGVSAFLSKFEDPEATPPPVKVETRDERQERKRREKNEQIAYKLEQEIAMWSANQDQFSEAEAFRTLFIARINYDTSESKLRREFEEFGPIRKITMCQDKEASKPRGYAFIEYEHERDMHAAYKHADGRKIDGRRVLVDVERGHTVKGWLPRRLGGGLGGTRRGGSDVNIKVSGREDGYGKQTADRDRFAAAARSPSRDRGLKTRERERDRDRDRDRGRRDRDRKGDEDRRRRSRSRDRDRERRGDRDRDRRRRSRSRDRRRGGDRRSDRMREDMDVRVKTDIKEEPDAAGYEYGGGGGFGGGGFVKKEPKEYYDTQEGQYGGFNAQDY